jgi:hypothetical protein
MQNKNSKISIKSYLEFAQLLDEYQGNHEENRTFALKQEGLSTNPKGVLLAWGEKNRYRIKEVSEHQSTLEQLSTLSNFIGLFSLLFGFFAGIGLLSYSGHAPVNVIYYLLFSMVIPLLSMLLSLISIVSSGELFNFVSLLFPLHWVEKVLEFFALKGRVDSLNRSFSPELKRWMFMSRLQLFSLLFSVGLLVALLVMVISKDIAFSWSTTLQVTPVEFFKLLACIGFPWGATLPSAIPSVELIEMSHYYRLGGDLDSQMIANADKLGAWWKYLAMVTLFYAIFLRFLVWLMSRYGYQEQLEKEFLLLDGVPKLLREFETPYVSTEAPKIENHLEIVSETDEQVSHTVAKRYDHIIGWNFSQDEIALVNDSKNIGSDEIDTVGGSHSFLEDQSVAELAKGRVLLYVKAWEPPTMDFVDFVEDIVANRSVEEVEVYPLGTPARYYESDEREVAIWKRKIQGLKNKKVWVIDATE